MRPLVNWERSHLSQLSQSSHETWLPPFCYPLPASLLSLMSLLSLLSFVSLQAIGHQDLAVANI